VSCLGSNKYCPEARLPRPSIGDEPEHHLILLRGQGEAGRHSAPAQVHLRIFGNKSNIQIISFGACSIPLDVKGVKHHGDPCLAFLARNDPLTVGIVRIFLWILW